MTQGTPLRTFESGWFIMYLPLSSPIHVAKGRPGPLWVMLKLSISVMKHQYPQPQRFKCVLLGVLRVQLTSGDMKGLTVCRSKLGTRHYTSMMFSARETTWGFLDSVVWQPSGMAKDMQWRIVVTTTSRTTASCIVRSPSTVNG